MKKKSSPSKEKTNSKEKTKEKKPKEKTKKKSDEPKETSTSNINNNNNNNNNIETQIPNFNNNYYNQLSNNNIINNITNENNPSLKKCDGCYQGDSSVYCTNCDKFFCKICDDQIHVVPFNRSHIRKDINLLFQYKKNCYHHNTNPLLYYCDTCNEPICIDCKEKGPHNSNLHNVCNIIEIYKKKFYEIKNLIEMKIKDKLNENVNKINYYNYIGNCIRDYKENIEKNIRKEFNNKIENINGIFGKKLAIINYESSMLQKDFNVVIEICNFVNEIKENGDMILFLLKYKHINEIIENQIAKHEYNNNNLYNEINSNNNEINNNNNNNDVITSFEKNDILNKYKRYEKLNKIKDEIIWKMLKDNNNNINNNNILNISNNTEILNKTKMEIEEWAKLSDKFANELSKYNLICCFCKKNLDENIINEVCEKNIDNNNNNFNNDDNNYIFNEDLIGTGRHFFVKNNSNPFDNNYYNDIVNSNNHINVNNKDDYDEENEE